MHALNIKTPIHLRYPHVVLLNVGSSFFQFVWNFKIRITAVINSVASPGYQAAFASACKMLVAWATGLMAAARSAGLNLQ